jgi:2-succinyl-5-enolpyruvyl-6-hydroxy-3-cyclohexene-1-carboxylate synthase
MEQLHSKNFKIILINNGGGIFRILPGHKETPVLIPSLKLPLFNSGTFSKMYGFDYTIASDEQSLSKGLATLYAQNEKPGLLEVFTPTLENDAILLQFLRNYSNFCKKLK